MFALTKLSTFSRGWRQLLIAFAATSFVLASSGSVSADPSYPIPYPWEDLIKPGRALQLLQEYIAFTKKNPEHYEAHLVLCQLSFVNWRLEKKDNKRRVEFAKTMLKSAQTLLKLGPDRPEGYHWVGAAVGTLALTRGVMNSLQLVPELKKNFERSIELDPKYLDGSALVQMARVYTMVPGFPVSLGDKEKAIKYLIKAKEIGPDFTLIYIYLADIYWHYGRTEDALAELDQIAKRKPKTEVQYFLHAVNLEKAKELRKLITSGQTRDPFYDVLSDIQPGLVD